MRVKASRVSIFSVVLSIFLMSFSGCSGDAYRLKNDDFPIGGNINHLAGSTIEGNLITTAIREVHELDIVFYPSRLISTTQIANLESEYINEQKERILSLFPPGAKDQFLVGTMRGKDIKRFVRDRSSLDFNTDLQVAGMKYHIHYVGGWPQYSYFSTERGHEIEDDRRYRIALSDYFYFSGDAFPGYKYGNGLNLRDFVEGRYISARDSLSQYLDSNREWPFLRTPRANVTKATIGSAGKLSIQQIRGPGHLSPYRGKEVTTSGVVTATGSLDSYPGGEELYIQTKGRRGNPKISSAIHVHHKNTNLQIEVGDYITVKGVVYEQQFNNGRARLSLREISRLEVKEKGVELPEPIVLGKNGVPIPDKYISRWNGNINIKPDLNLDEAIDFYKSIEGMRVSIENPRVVGFRGGNENDFDTRPKNYLNLYVLADGDTPHKRDTPGGGIIIDQLANNFNPQIIQLQSNHFSANFYPESFYDVGQIIEGELVGIMGYLPNIFGDGEHAFFLPQPSEPLKTFADQNTSQTRLEDRPQTSLIPGKNQLTVATYNVENLAGSQTDRFEYIGESIAVNLKCPDILALTEIQDESAVSFRGDSDARGTLQKIVANTHCPHEVDYKLIHVSPFLHSDGGQPGGNIQVAFLYNSNRVDFTPRGEPASIMDVYLRRDGGLAINPSRLFSQDDSFQNTRKSLLVEFKFNGERVFVLGNHLNSKFGDTPMWGAQQPYNPRSDNSRQQKAKELNRFVQKIALKSPDSHIIVLGDFNAFIHDDSMRVLAGTHLQNLTTYRDLVPFHDRYTYNFNGNSQAIDHIFVGPSLLRKRPELEIPHINTDFMGRIADHDPIIARFTFGPTEDDE